MSPRAIGKKGQWQKLPRGRFTGIEWSDPDSFRQSDPYLAWAETSGFAGFRSPQGQSANPEWLPLLIELQEPFDVKELIQRADPKWLLIPKVYQTLGPALRVCTARAKRGFFDALDAGGVLHGLIKRYELGLPVGHHAKALAAAASPSDNTSSPPETLLHGDVIVVIDNGLALAHADFLTGRTKKKTRVAAFWRQDEFVGPHGRAAASLKPIPLDNARAGHPPSDIGYGHQLIESKIEADIAKHTNAGRVDEDALYRYWQMWELNHQAHHGTHITSLLAGPVPYVQTIGTEDSPPDWNPVDDPASRAPLLVVQLDWASVADSSGGALNVSVLDAMAWALARCAKTASVTVNLSWGALAGPHNGSALLETALTQLISASGRKVNLVIPAGNAYQARTHANSKLDPGKSVALHWRIQPDDHSQSFLELWFEDSQKAALALNDVSIELTPPGSNKPLEPIVLGDSRAWPSSTAPQCAVLFPPICALGHPGVCALIALAPTATWFSNTVLTHPGVWKLNIVNGGRRSVTMDAYIERDDVALGSAPTGARQSYLEDARYDTSGGLGGWVDHSDNPTPVRRSGTFNDIATSPHTVSVGGIRYFHNQAAHGYDNKSALYSPRSPDPDALRPERLNVKKVPDRFAVSDEHATLWGVRGAGTRSASCVRLVGTSMAAPQVARPLVGTNTNSQTEQ